MMGKDCEFWQAEHKLTIKVAKKDLEENLQESVMHFKKIRTSKYLKEKNLDIIYAVINFDLTSQERNQGVAKENFMKTLFQYSGRVKKTKLCCTQEPD